MYLRKLLFSLGGFSLTLGLAGGISALLVWLLFALLWRFLITKKASGEGFRGWMNAVGYGFFPALAVWKIFEATGSEEVGAEVFAPLSPWPFFTEGGRFLPGRAEAVAALLCLAGLSVWLMLRKKEPGRSGEVFWVAACLWAGTRATTEQLRREPRRWLLLCLCGAALFCLALWTARRNRRAFSLARTAGDWTAALLCAAMICLTGGGVLPLGSEVSNLAAGAGSALLLTLLTLLCAADSRRGDAGENAGETRG